MTGLADELAAIELAGANPMAWLHELRDSHGRWTDSPDVEAGPAGSIHRYKIPPHDRLISPRGRPKDPADHPFFLQHPVSPKNLVDLYDNEATDEGMRAQGRHWYPDGHRLAGQLAGGDAEKGAILLSSYSPRSIWPANMFNASRAYEEGHALGPGEGMNIMGIHVAPAEKALEGATVDEAFEDRANPKRRSFAKLIARGDDDPSDPYGHVVVDTHALNAAAGGALAPEELEPAPIDDPRYHEYVADQYRQAAKMISKRDGVLMKPHELQAILWLNQLPKTAALAAARAEANPRLRGTLKGKAQIKKNAWKRWLAYAKEQGLPVMPGTTAPLPSDLAAQILYAQALEMMGSSIAAQIELIGDGHGHHIPGTPFVYKHGWIPLVPGLSHADLHEYVRTGKVPGGHKPEPGAEPAGGREALDAAIKSGIKSERAPGSDKVEGSQGLQGATTIVTFKDGSHYIRKDYKYLPIPVGLQNFQVRKEVLAAKVSNALGAGAPDIMPTGPTQFYEPKIDGVSAMEYFDQGAHADQMDKILNSPAGQRIGLMDLVIGHADRHFGNIMITPGGQPVPIDHNDTWGSVDVDGNLVTNSPFSAALERQIAAGNSPFTPADIDQFTARIKKLKPEFDAMPMDQGGILFDYTMRKLADIRAQVAK